jgi:hypothetical protein
MLFPFTVHIACTQRLPLLRMCSSHRINSTHTNLCYLLRSYPLSTRVVSMFTRHLSWAFTTTCENSVDLYCKIFNFLYLWSVFVKFLKVSPN